MGSGGNGSGPRSTFKLDLDGVVQDYRQVRADGQEFLGHGVFLLSGAEPGGQANRVLWWFFDSTGQPPGPPAAAGMRPGSH